MSHACSFCGRADTELLDRGAIMRDYGVTAATAERFMRQLPKVDPPDIRKVFVRRGDLDQMLESWQKGP